MNSRPCDSRHRNGKGEVPVSKSRIANQTLVRHMTSGRVGVTVNDLMSCCTDEETPVVYDGDAAFLGTPTDELEVLGPENAVADFAKCGGGRGAECCRFLTLGAGGFHCERHGDLRYTLIFRDDMTAARKPDALYPLCQLPVAMSIDEGASSEAVNS